MHICMYVCMYARILCMYVCAYTMHVCMYVSIVCMSGRIVRREMSVPQWEKGNSAGSDRNILRCWMDGWMDEWMDGWVGMDGWMDGIAKRFLIKCLIVGYCEE